MEVLFGSLETISMVSNRERLSKGYQAIEQQELMDRLGVQQLSLVLEGTGSLDIRLSYRTARYLAMTVVDLATALTCCTVTLTDTFLGQSFSLESVSC